MKVAVIDIGTNTALLLVARRGPQGEPVTILDLQRYPRLGRNVDARRMLHPDSMQRVLDVLTEYRSIITGHRPDAVVVSGTSAVRDAENREEFRDAVRATTGFRLEILNGNEEAVLTYRGAVSGLPKLSDATVIDIGGGSTEVTSGSEGRVISFQSLDVGSVRMTERFLVHDPPTHTEIESMTGWLRAEFGQLESPPTGSTLVGVAGTATSLAILHQGLSDYSREAVAGYRMSRTDVEALSRRLAAAPSDLIRTFSNALEGREDIITAGTLILSTYMGCFGFESLTVSERGIRYGLALRTFEGAFGSTGASFAQGRFEGLT